MLLSIHCNDSFWRDNSILFLKLLIVPTLIALVSVGSRVWGPRVSGILAGLPIIAGPIVIFIALDRGASFGVVSSRAALAGISSIGLFCFVYAIASQKHGVLLSLVLGHLGFMSSTLILWLCDIPLVATLLLSLASLTIFILLFPTPLNAQQTTLVVRWRETMVRMVAAAGLVVVVTYCADLLGPRLSGLLAPFPIAGTVLASFTHRNFGDAAARRLLAGFLNGLFGTAIFFFVLACTMASYGILLTVLLAIPAAVITSGVSERCTKHLATRRQ